MHDVLLILSTSQCWPTSSRHCVNIAYAFAPYPYILFTSWTLSTSQCWRTSSRQCVLHCVPSFLFTSSTSQCWPTSNRHCRPYWKTLQLFSTRIFHVISKTQNYTFYNNLLNNKTTHCICDSYFNPKVKKITCNNWGYLFTKVLHVDYEFYVASLYHELILWSWFIILHCKIDCSLVNFFLTTF